MLTVAEALALTDRQLWGMGPVTVSGVLYANGLLCCLVDREGDPNGILLLADKDKELPIVERLMDSDCMGFAIGGGSLLFFGPTEVTGALGSMSFPMFRRVMGGITRIVHRGVEARSGVPGPAVHRFSVE